MRSVSPFCLDGSRLLCGCGGLELSSLLGEVCASKISTVNSLSLFMEAFCSLMNFLRGIALWPFLAGAGELSTLRDFLLAVDGFCLLFRPAGALFSVSMPRLLYLSAVGLVTISLLNALALARSSVFGLNFMMSRGWLWNRSGFCSFPHVRHGSGICGKRGEGHEAEARVVAIVTLKDQRVISKSTLYPGGCTDIARGWLVKAKSGLIYLRSSNGGKSMENAKAKKSKPPN